MSPHLRCLLAHKEELDFHMGRSRGHGKVALQRRAQRRDKWCMSHQSAASPSLSRARVVHRVRLARAPKLFKVRTLAASSSSSRASPAAEVCLWHFEFAVPRRARRAAVVFRSSQLSTVDCRLPRGNNSDKVQYCTVLCTCTADSKQKGSCAVDNIGMFRLQSFGSLVHVPSKLYSKSNLRDFYIGLDCYARAACARRPSVAARTKRRIGGRRRTCLGALPTEYAPTNRPSCRRNTNSPTISLYLI